MIDVSEIDLDKLTELELVELRYRIDVRLDRYADEHSGHGRVTGGHLGSFLSEGFTARMESHA